MAARIEKVVTSGQFALDGGSWDVDNNVWLVGDDAEVVVIDAPTTRSPILDAIAGRTVLAIVLHSRPQRPHQRRRRARPRPPGADVWFPPADRMLWDAEHDEAPDHDLRRRRRPSTWPARRWWPSRHRVTRPAAPACIPRISAPVQRRHAVRGWTRRNWPFYSDFPTIIDSIREHLLSLPPETVVHTGHGDDTTIGAEAPHLDEWIARGA